MMHIHVWRGHNKLHEKKLRQLQDKQIKVHEENKQVIFKNFAPFTDRISKINNTQVDNDLRIKRSKDAVIKMFDLIEYTDI